MALLRHGKVDLMNGQNYPIGSRSPLSQRTLGSALISLMLILLSLLL